LCFLGSWKLSSSFVASFVESNKVLIVIIILIAIDTKGRARRPCAPRRIDYEQNYDQDFVGFDDVHDEA